MTALDLAGGSGGGAGTGPGGGAGTKPTPSAPPKPAPTKAQTPARQTTPQHAGGPVVSVPRRDGSEGSRAGSTAPAPGAVSGRPVFYGPIGAATFALPVPLGPPRFDEGEHRLVGRVRPPQPGQPSPQPGPNPPPVPHPPPPLGGAW